MSMLIIDEDHYAREVDYGSGARTFSKEKVGTRYLFVAFRTFVYPNDPADMGKVRALTLSDTLPDLTKTFGNRGQVDPVRHLIGTASAWGGNPDEDAIYLNVTPTRNDAKTVYRLGVSAMFPSMLSGRSSSMTRLATSRKTLSTPIR